MILIIYTKDKECIVKSIPDLAVRQACTRALGMEEFDGKRVREEISRIVSPKDGWLVVCLKNGQTYTDCFRSVLDPVEKQGKKENCFTNRIRCGFCGHYYNDRYNALASRFEATRAEYEKVTAAIAEKGIRRRELERFIQAVEKLPEMVSDFDEALWGSLVEKITVNGKDDIVFTMASGMEIKA